MSEIWDALSYDPNFAIAIANTARVDAQEGKDRNGTGSHFQFGH